MRRTHYADAVRAARMLGPIASQEALDPSPAEVAEARAAVAVDYQRKAAVRAANARACLCAVATSTDPGPFIVRNQDDAARAYRMARLAAGIES